MDILDEQLTNEQKKVLRKSDLEKLIPSKESEIDSLTKDEGNTAASIAALEGVIREREISVEELAKKLEFSGKREAQEHIDSLMALRQVMKKALDDAQLAFAEKKYAWVSSLSNTANGNISGGSRVRIVV